MTDRICWHDFISSASTPLVAFSLCLFLANVPAVAADQMTVTVTNALKTPRPAETIVVPWSEIARRLPGTLPNHILIKDASGATVPDQLIDFKPEEHHDNYDSLIFQHDFAAGESSATFTLETAEKVVPPFPTRTFARHVPERYDDFAWENDRIAHRIYGPVLGTPAAGRDQMFSSGIDVWCKRVRYPIVDRWYLMGHYHEDTGEGLDLYDVGKSRGCGGVGIWDGKQLFVSKNWATCKVLARGPVRAEFELTYEPWDAGNGIKVSETKRITLEAGQNLDEIESTFSFTPSATPLTVAIGLAKHTGKDVTAVPMQNEKAGWFGVWATYPTEGHLGTGVILPSGTGITFAQDDLNYLAPIQVKSGETMRYFAGAGWEKSGDFSDQASWENYLTDFAARLKSPLTISYSDAK